MEAVKTLGASDKTGKVRKSHEAFHQSHAPSPICRVDPENIGEAVRVIHARIKLIRLKEVGGTYLFIDRNLDAFAISESRTCIKAWITGHFAELVGFYTYVKRHNLPILKPTFGGLAEDIQDHLRELGNGH